MDPAKRKKYDSSLPFDENIPDEDDFTDFNFFEVFSKVFTLNAKWSVKKPVPNLGDEHSPMKEVHRFYKFWEDFKSWREFSQYDEYDVTDAQDRYERRYMEQENKRTRKPYEKAERTRLIKLFQMAYDNDPRIKKEAAEEEAEKQRKKDEAKGRKQAVKDEKERVIREAREKKEEEARKKEEEKKAEENEKKVKAIAWKQALKELIALCSENFQGSRYDKYWVSAMENKLKPKEKIDFLMEKIAGIAAEHGDDTQAKIAAFEQTVDEWQNKGSAEKKAALQAEEAKKKSVAVADQGWSQEEI